MGAIFNPPKPQKPRDPIIDIRQEADVSVPIDADGGAVLRKRMDAARNRTGRGALQIPHRPSGGGTGVAIPR